MNIVIKFGKRRLGMRARRGWLAAATAMLFLTAGCASSAGGAARGSIDVVTSTDVYGQLVEGVAGRLTGKRVRVTPIIDNPGVDPHSYEANARTQLAISRADLIVENGGGYDDFVDKMRAAADSKAPVLNAARISGKHGPDLNEHVWYDFPTMRAVLTRIAGALSTLDRSHAGSYRANARALDVRIAGLERTEAAIRARHTGTGVAITEPVPLYLLTACGLVNRTPAAFSESIEEGTDVATNVLRQTLDLFRVGKVALLAYNEQTSGVETRRVLAAAKANGVAVVPVTETLPAGKTYVQWMTDNLAAVRTALS